jgi:hypothetical protein
MRRRGQDRTGNRHPTARQQPIGFRPRIQALPSVTHKTASRVVVRTLKGDWIGFYNHNDGRIKQWE